MFPGAGQRNQVLGQGALLARAWSLLHKASVEAVSAFTPNFRACRSFNGLIPNQIHQLQSFDGLSLDQIQQELSARTYKWSQVTLRDQRQSKSSTSAYTATLAVKAQIQQELARYDQWIRTGVSQLRALGEKESSPQETELTPSDPHQKPLLPPTPRAKPYQRQEQCDQLLPVFSMVVESTVPREEPSIPVWPCGQRMSLINTAKVPEETGTALYGNEQRTPESSQVESSPVMSSQVKTMKSRISQRPTPPSQPYQEPQSNSRTGKLSGRSSS